MRISVFGNRNIEDKELVISEFNNTIKKYITDDGYDPSKLTFLHGGAVGPQRYVMDFVEQAGYNTVAFKPYHMVDKSIEFSTKLFYMRNKQIINNSDMVIVFTNGNKDSEVDRVVSYAERVGAVVIKIGV